MTSVMQTMLLALLLQSTTGAISGRVTDGTTGLAGANVVVQALKASYENGHRVMKVVKATRTNDLGEYRLFWLEPGAYYVTVIQPTLDLGPYANVASDQRNVTVRPLAGGLKEDEAYLPVYFPGTPDISSASRIDLKSGADIGGVNISLMPARTFRVRGVLVNEQPVPYESIRLLRVDPEGYTLAGSASTDDRGVFTIQKVPSGSYVLFARVVDSLARMPVDVRNADVDVTFPATRGFDIPGRLILDGQPKNKLELRVGLNLDPPAIVNWESTGLMGTLGGLIFELAHSEVADDGSFILKNVPKGDFRMNVVDGNAPLQDAYLKSIHIGNTDVLNAGLRIDRQPDGPIDIVIGTDVATVEGRVLDSNKQPMEGLHVVLSPDAGLRSRTDLHKTARTDSSGRFQLKGIAPGQYRLVALDKVDDGAWLDPFFMRMYEEQAMTLRISGDSHETVDLVVTRPPPPNR